MTLPTVWRSVLSDKFAVYSDRMPESLVIMYPLVLGAF